MKMSEAANDTIRERWLEILNTGITVAEAEPDEGLPGYVTLQLDPEDADHWSLHPVLSIDPEGKIAECLTEIPFYYPSFASLIVAASARQVATERGELA